MKQSPLSLHRGTEVLIKMFGGGVWLVLDGVTRSCVAHVHECSVTYFINHTTFTQRVSPIKAL